MSRFAFVLCCLAVPAFAAEEFSVSPINLDVARQQFQAAQEIEVPNEALLNPDWSAVSRKGDFTLVGAPQ
jgi:hypothetical protein